MSVRSIGGSIGIWPWILAHGCYESECSLPSDGSIIWPHCNAAYWLEVVVEVDDVLARELCELDNTEFVAVRAVSLKSEQLFEATA